MSIKSLFANKKLWSIVLVVGEIVLIALLLTLSIATMVVPFGSISAGTPGFMGVILWLQDNTIAFFILIVLPLIVLFLVNIYFLVRALYADKKKKEVVATKEELMAEAKRQARAELLQEMEEQKKKAPAKK